MRSGSYAESEAKRQPAKIMSDRRSCIPMRSVTLVRLLRVSISLTLFAISSISRETRKRGKISQSQSNSTLQFQARSGNIFYAGKNCKFLGKPPTNDLLPKDKAST